MRLRDAVEDVLRSWNRYELARTGTQVIDYDCAPVEEEPPAASSRLQVFERLSALATTPEAEDEPVVLERLGADLAYVRALLGERQPLPAYIAATQGCGCAGWADDYIVWRGDLLRDSLDALGVTWGASTDQELAKTETAIELDAAPDAIRHYAEEFEPAVRAATGAEAEFDLHIESAEVDAYWSYWLDGRGKDARLRLNKASSQYTDVVARQFALHEVLGHALKGASYFARCSREDVAWVRLMSVHAQQQVLFEGLAQALPLFVAQDHTPLIARVRLAHYTQLVRAEMHLAVNSGTPISECALFGRERVPFWTDSVISDVLIDRSINPQLRSYLWSYPAGIDWFVNLAETGGIAATNVLRAAYRDPLTPADLTRLWPSGPTVGGPTIRTG